MGCKQATFLIFVFSFLFIFCVVCGFLSGILQYTEYVVEHEISHNEAPADQPRPLEARIREDGTYFDSAGNVRIAGSVTETYNEPEGNHWCEYLGTPMQIGAYFGFLVGSLGTVCCQNLMYTTEYNIRVGVEERERGKADYCVIDEAESCLPKFRIKCAERLVIGLFVLMLMMLAIADHLVNKFAEQYNVLRCITSASFIISGTIGCLTLGSFCYLETVAGQFALKLRDEDPSSEQVIGTGTQYGIPPPPKELEYGWNYAEVDTDEKDLVKAWKKVLNSQSVSSDSESSSMSSSSNGHRRLVSRLSHLLNQANTQEKFRK